MGLLSRTYEVGLNSVALRRSQSTKLKPRVGFGAWHVDSPSDCLSIHKSPRRTTVTNAKIFKSAFAPRVLKIESSRFFSEWPTLRSLGPYSAALAVFLTVNIQSVIGAVAFESILQSQEAVPGVVSKSFPPMPVPQQFVLAGTQAALINRNCRCCRKCLFRYFSVILSLSTMSKKTSLESSAHSSKSEFSGHVRLE